MWIANERETPARRCGQQQRRIASRYTRHFRAGRIHIVKMLDRFKKENRIECPAAKRKRAGVGDHTANAKLARDFVPKYFDADDTVPPPREREFDCTVPGAHVEHASRCGCECCQYSAPANPFLIAVGDERISRIDQRQIGAFESRIAG